MALPMRESLKKFILKAIEPITRINFGSYKGVFDHYIGTGNAKDRIACVSIDGLDILAVHGIEALLSPKVGEPIVSHLGDVFLRVDIQTLQ